MKREREDLSDTADSKQNFRLKFSGGFKANSSPEMSNTIIWNHYVDKCLLREMSRVRKRLGIYSFVRNWDDGWVALVATLRKTSEFPASVTKEQLVERIVQFILPSSEFDPKSRDRPTSVYEGLIYDVFHDHELCSPLQAENYVPLLQPPVEKKKKRKPTSSGSALIVATSGEAVEKCKDIISSYCGYLSPRERGVLARALETYTVTKSLQHMHA